MYFNLRTNFPMFRSSSSLVKKLTVKKSVKWMPTIVPSRKYAQRFRDIFWSAPCQLTRLCLHVLYSTEYGQVRWVGQLLKLDCTMLTLVGYKLQNFTNCSECGVLRKFTQRSCQTSNAVRDLAPENAIKVWNNSSTITGSATFWLKYTTVCV